MTVYAPRVDTADLFEWLPEAAIARPGSAVVTVLPDAQEVGMTHAAWRRWFTAAAALCFEASAGPTVFLQTDRLHDGQWTDKAGLIATMAGHDPLLWHKIVLRRDPWKVDLHRPTYSHLIAYGPGAGPGRRTPDVIHGGKPWWRNGIGVDAARFIAGWLRDVGVSSILNPACGEGTILSACSRSMAVAGCDVDEDRAASARAALDAYADWP